MIAQLKVLNKIKWEMCKTPWTSKIKALAVSYWALFSMVYCQPYLQKAKYQQKSGRTWWPNWQRSTKSDERWANVISISKLFVPIKDRLLGWGLIGGGGLWSTRNFDKIVKLENAARAREREREIILFFGQIYFKNKISAALEMKPLL